MANRENVREKPVATFTPIFAVPADRYDEKYLSKPQKLALSNFVLREESVKDGSGSERSKKAPSIKLTDLDHKDLDALLAKNTKKVMAYSMSTPQVSHSQVGFLILERTTFEPVGTVPSNEVLKSIFLAPGGEVELTKKTWSKYETEFVEASEQIRNEEREASNSANKEIAESFKSQFEFKQNMSASANVIGTVGAVTLTEKMTSSLGLAMSQAASLNIKEIQGYTETAAARISQEHKVSYTQRTEFTSEYSTTESFKNPNSTHGVTLVLSKLLQKWKIRHEQYGARLCIDVMVKNPGRFLRHSSLPDSFNPEAVSDPDPLNPPPSAPPVPQEVITESKAITFPSSDQTKIAAWYIPPGYELDFATAIGDDGSAVTFSQISGRPGFIRGNQMGLGYYSGKYVGNYVNNYNGDRVVAEHIPQTTVTVTAYFQRTAAHLQRWVDAARPFQIEVERRAWEILNNAKLVQQHALDTGSTVPPSQILRKEERDQLFAGVTNFIATGDDTPEPLGAAGLNPSSIRRLHEALEWEAMGSLVYPFWWDTSIFGYDPDILNDEVAKLVHKDFLRREFVRASWARVMVPIRPGYEYKILVELYGPAMKVALDAGDESAAAPYGDLVKAYKSVVAAEQVDGEYGIQEDETNIGQFLPPTPTVVAEWYEYVPTDEISAEMELVRDRDGKLIDIAEPYLRQSQDEGLAHSSAAGAAKSALAAAIVADPSGGSSKVSTESSTIEFDPDQTND